MSLEDDLDDLLDEASTSFENRGDMAKQPIDVRLRGAELEQLRDPEPGYLAKGAGAFWLDETPSVTRVYGDMSHLGSGRLPLKPPGRGGETRERPEPSREAFDRSRDRQPLSQLDQRAYDIEKLRALTEDADVIDKLHEGEQEAFPSMLERLERSAYSVLTEKQRAWVDKALYRLEISVDEPEQLELLPEYVVPKHPLAPAAPYSPLREREIPRGDSICSECGEPQFGTPGGLTCDRGHAGALPWPSTDWRRLTPSVATVLAELWCASENVSSILWRPFKGFDPQATSAFIPLARKDDSSTIGAVCAWLARAGQHEYVIFTSKRKFVLPVAFTSPDVAHLVVDELMIQTPDPEFILNPMLEDAEFPRRPTVTVPYPPNEIFQSYKEAAGALLIEMQDDGTKKLVPLSQGRSINTFELPAVPDRIVTLTKEQGEPMPTATSITIDGCDFAAPGAVDETGSVLVEMQPDGSQKVVHFERPNQFSLFAKQHEDPEQRPRRRRRRSEGGVK